MKIGEELSHAFEKGTHILTSEKDREGILSIVPGYLLKSFAIILVADAAMRNGIDPDKNETLQKIIPTLSNAIRLTSMQQYAQLNDFLNWWVDQASDSIEIVDDDGDEDEICWFELHHIAKMWNEFADKEIGGRA